MRRSWFLLSAFIPVLMLVVPQQTRALDRSSVDQYRAHLEKLRGLVEACEANASACDEKAVGNDEQVQIEGLGVGANANSIEAHYDWLRDVLKTARNAGKNRDHELRAAAAKLDEALRDAGGEGPVKVDIAAARRRADAILGHPEFATARVDSIWQRILGHIFLWLDRLFSHVADFGKKSPWIGPVMEWGLVAIALVVLALWAMRVLRRQRLAVRMEAAREVEPWEQAARNWRTLAEERATAGDWREAVHCLYWASIAALEGRRLWSPNRSRTPREYVRLLEAGSARWKLLRQQTQGFEHVWYGLNEAAKQDYERALELHEGLRAA